MKTSASFNRISAGLCGIILLFSGSAGSNADSPPVVRSDMAAFSSPATGIPETGHRRKQRQIRYQSGKFRKSHKAMMYYLWFALKHNSAG